MNPDLFSFLFFMFSDAILFSTLLYPTPTRKDTISEIILVSIQYLPTTERTEMIEYMKKSMAGTFFDKWLLMSGWMSTGPKEDESSSPQADAGKKRAADLSSEANEEVPPEQKRVKEEETCESQPTAGVAVAAAAATYADADIGVTSQAELEKLIRAIASNQALTAAQKSTTLQGLRDSVWKSNQRHKEQHCGMAEAPPTIVNASVASGPTFLSQSGGSNGIPKPTSSSMRRVTPPSMYFKKMKGKLEMVWNSESSPRIPNDDTVPLFSAAELAPTNHDGAAGSVLGCPHYARACKLRHPESGKWCTLISTRALPRFVTSHICCVMTFLTLPFSWTTSTYDRPPLCVPPLLRTTA